MGDSDSNYHPFLKNFLILFSTAVAFPKRVFQERFSKSRSSVDEVTGKNIFEGKEASCRNFTSFFKYLDSRGLPYNKFLKNIPHDLAYLNNPKNRVSWQAIVQLAFNMEEGLSRQGVVNFGRFLCSGENFTVPFVQYIAPIFFSVEDLYFFMARPVGGGNSNLGCLTSSCKRIGPNYLELTSMVDEGYQHCNQLFWLMKGVLETMPNLLGAGDAQVTLVPIERGARYFVTIPSSWGFVPLIRKIFRIPKALFMLLRESKTAFSILQEQHFNLRQQMAWKEHAERENQKLQQKLKAINEGLEVTVKERTQELERSNRDLEKFAYLISHDMRGPLNTVQIYLDLLQEELAEKDVLYEKRYVQNSLRLLQNLCSQIKSMLEYHRIEGRRDQFVDVNMSEVVGQVRDSLENNLAKNERQFTCGELPTVQGNFYLLSLLFRNLLENSLKFQKAGTIPRVSIQCRRESDRFIISLEDNGQGIAEEKIQRVREILAGENFLNNYSGPGIGLAICKKVVEVHKGEIWCDTQKNRGSTFYFSLPASKSS